MAFLLFQKIASLFLCIAAGFILVKSGLVESGDSRVLAVVNLYSVIPCMIIQAFQIDLTKDILVGFVFAFALAVAEQIVLILLVRAGAGPMRLNNVERASLIYSNAGNLNFPLILALMGPEWIIFASTYVCMQTFFIWTHGVSLISGQSIRDWKKILGNVNVISVLIGFAMMVTGLRLPGILAEAVDSLASTVGPMSMVIIGMVMAGVDLKKALSGGRIFLLAFLKLIVFPLLIMLLLRISQVETLVPNGDGIVYILFLAVCAPSGVMVTQLAQLYDAEAEAAASINVVTTLLCIASMPLMTWLYYL